MKDFKYIGKSVPRIDAADKASGKIKYMSDLNFPGMLFGKILRAKYPHALIKKIDTSQAKALPGVVAVVTWEDVPGLNGFGIVVPDQPVLCEDKVRYIGDAVVAVAAETKEIAEEAIKLITVEYEPLPIVDDPIKATQPDSPKVHTDGNIHLHTKISRGDVKKGFKEADVIVEHTYYTGMQEHVFLETESGVSKLEEDGTLSVYAGSQYPQRDQMQLSRCLALNPRKIHVVSYPVGGAFGGKDELTIQPILGLLALKTKRPVKIVMSREESIISYWKRHPMIMKYKTGVKKDGTLIANEVKIYADTGAYASLGGPVLNLAIEHACGPYKLSNVNIDGYCIYTNNGTSGAFRGFGVPQATFAMETQMDIIAEKLRIDPVELRRKNALRRGDIAPIGNRLTTSVGTVAVLDGIRKTKLWQNREKYLVNDFKKPWIKKGFGIALTYQGTGLGVGLPDYGGAILKFCKNGGFEVGVGLVDYGQGIGTSYAQIAAEAMKCPIDKINVLLGDTDTTADSGPTSASRGVYTGGKAIIIAAERMIKILKSKASEILGVSADNLTASDGCICASNEPEKKVFYEEIASRFMNETCHLPQTEGYFLMPVADIKIKDAFGLPHNIFAFSAHLTLIEVNTLTGQTKVLKGAEVIDAGDVINRQGLEGQSEGGFVMGMGYGLFENMIVEKGIFKTTNFSTYIIPSIEDAPFEIETVTIVNPEETGPYRAKGVAETVMGGTAPAITNAIYNAVGVRIFKIPATSEVVYTLLKEKEKTE
ncbi:MAG: xanthine dehydrogenase family protein molybdopterin-binding subunit [Caldiserica bacterium]|nr:MAG: xanthine dehydrogenase family protein molybdopterin-binding subunit [Caldisericota bacterium]